MSVSTAQKPAMVLALLSGALGICISLVLGQNDPVVGVAIGAAAAVVLQNLMALVYCRSWLDVKTYPLLRWARRSLS